MVDAIDTDGSSGIDARPPADASPHADAPPSVGPFQDLHLWKDGCSTELWGRWTNSASFVLGGIVVKTLGGTTVATKTYLDTPAFEAGRDDAWQFFDSDSFPDSTYEVSFDLATGTDPTVTVALDPDFYRGPELFTVTQVEQSGPGGGLAVTVRSAIDGYVERVMTYDSSFCLQARKVFYTEPSLAASSTTALDIGGWYESGTVLNITVEGVDTGIYYTFYSVIFVTVP